RQENHNGIQRRRRERRAGNQLAERVSIRAKNFLAFLATWRLIWVFLALPAGQRMKTKAAIAYKAGAPLTIETVDVEGPKAGEVLVEIKATGICHTDEFTLSGADPEGLFPSIMGHEGAGLVVDTGPGVTTLRQGDHVIPLYVPECRQCE